MITHKLLQHLVAVTDCFFWEGGEVFGGVSIKEAENIAALIFFLTTCNDSFSRNKLQQLFRRFFCKL